MAKRKPRSVIAIYLSPFDLMEGGIWFHKRCTLIWWKVEFDFINGAIWFHRRWNLIWWKVKLLIWEVSQWEPGCWWCEGASGDYYYCMGGCWVWCILYFEILNFFCKRHIWWLLWYVGCRVCCIFKYLVFFEEASGDYFCMGAAGFAAADGENRLIIKQDRPS